MNLNLYKFFFTHLAQQFDAQSGVTLWIDPLSTTTLKPEFREENTIAFYLPNTQPSGTVNLQVASGSILLEASSSITVDHDWTADSTVQPVQNFITNLLTPISPSNLTLSYTLPLAGVDISQTRPDQVTVTFTNGVYPTQTSTTGPLIRNHVMAGPADYEIPFTGQNANQFSYLTADIDWLTVDSSNITRDLQNSLFTADRVSFYEKAYEDKVLIEPIPASNSVTETLVTGVPEGSVILGWTIGNVISQAYIPAPERGYIPLPTISTEMGGGASTLKEIALSLLALIQLGDASLILSVIKELTYLWANTFGNIGPDGSLNLDATPGLPASLPVSITQPLAVDNTRSTLEQAWLGYALVQCLKYLRSRPPAQILELPTYTDLLLKQLALVVSNATDLSTGDCYVGFDEYGYLIDTPDLSSAVISQLFLQESLSVSYDLYVHQAAAKLYIKLYSSIKVPTTGSDQDPLSKFFWNVVQKIDLGTNALVATINDYLANNQFGDFEQGLWVFLLLYQQLFGVTYAGISYSGLSDSPFLQLQQPLYVRRAAQGQVQSTTPTLLASSWVVLFNNLLNSVVPELQFDLAALDALAFQTFMYQEAKRMMPFGYKWPKEDSLNKAARLGAFLFSIASISFAWYLAFSILRDGRNLLSAQGWSLDHYGRSFLYPRPLLQPDSFYRNFIFQILATDRATLDSLQSIAQRYGVSIIIEEPLVLTYQFEGQNYSWTASVEDCSRVRVDTPVQTIRDYYPFSDRLTELQVSTSWSNVAPKVVLYTDEVCPTFSSELEKSISVGIDMKLYARLYADDTLQTYTTTTVKPQ
jgi:hypothetical protein